MQKKIQELIQKYNLGKCSPEEKEWLEQWYQSFEWNKNDDLTSEAEINAARDELWEVLRKHKQSFGGKAPVHKMGTRSSFRIGWRSAAAVLFFAVVGIAVFYVARKPANETNTVAAVDPPGKNVDVSPGTSKAQLVMADGSIISLDSIRTMRLQEKDGTQIDKHSGKLVYNDVGAGRGDVLYNTLSTPRGGEYQLVLPDGSRVWLNAASSIKFPTKFTGKNRTVFLQGEAYFEVTTNKEMPFRVKLQNDLTVQVLGTHFNIMDYSDEADVRTTLVEGVVKVTNQSGSVLLSPSKQAVMKRNDQTITVGNADVAKVLAWKNGMIEFDGDNLPYIMRQLSRWYDIEVNFAGSISKETYKGAIRRQAPLSKVLEILKVAGVTYILEGKNLTITGS